MWVFGRHLIYKVQQANTNNLSFLYAWLNIRLSEHGKDLTPVCGTLQEEADSSKVSCKSLTGSRVMMYVGWWTLNPYQEPVCLCWEELLCGPPNWEGKTITILREGGKGNHVLDLVQAQVSCLQFQVKEMILTVWVSKKGFRFCVLWRNNKAAQMWWVKRISVSSRPAWTTRGDSVLKKKGGGRKLEPE